MNLLKRNKRIASEFRDKWRSYSDIAREYGITPQRVKEIVEKRLGEKKAKEIMEEKKERNRLKKLEYKRNLPEEVRQRKLAYMREYNKTYKRKDR